MKKILLTIVLLLNIIWFSYAAEDFTSYIKNNFEYINFDGDKLISSTEYKTNKWNSIYFMWRISFYDIKDKRTLDYMLDETFQWKRVVFLITKDKKNRILNVEDNNYNINLCYKIDTIWRKLLQWNVWAKIIDYSKTLILGKDWETFNCFREWNNIILPLTDLWNIDSNFIIKNQNNITKNVWKIVISKEYKSKWWNTVKGIYDFIMNNAEYDYDALSNASSTTTILNTQTYPWGIAAFFSWKKIVCDGYTKTMIFILNMAWIKANRIVGKIQPIEKSELNVPWILHSWVNIWNYHLDPTFDDKDEWGYWNDYFAKTKTCFNLNHYTTWWILFDTTTKRYNYILNNSKYIINNCLWIAKASLFNDWYALDFIKHTLQKYDVATNKKIFCELFNMCSIYWESKKDFVTNLSKYTLTLFDGKTQRKYDLWEELSGLKIE